MERQQSVENSLVIFTKASQMLVEANTIQKAKELKDLALTAADWAKRKKMGDEAVQYAQSYALRAERKMGEMLRSTKLAKGTRMMGGNTGGPIVVPPAKDTPTLAELGLTKNESSRAQLLANLPEEKFKKIETGKITIPKAIKEIKIEQAKKKVESEYMNEEIKPIIYPVSNDECDVKCDLLITDPPYMTDIEDINEFAKWLPEKLKLVKETGFAFVFIGAYPRELQAYLNVAMPDQVLVWTYKNTLGQNPKDKYKLNWQAILFYRMPKAPALNCPLTSEQWAVQEVNAPDGRLGDRYHTWQKPMELAERLIRHTTKKDDVVLDPFSGTGTFLLAASKLGRKAIGYEKDPQMIEIAKRRGCEIG